MQRRAVPEGPTLADGVRRLRAAVVGDVRELAATPIGRRPRQMRQAAPERVPQTLAALGAPVPAHNDVVGVPWWSENANWGPDVVRWTERTSPPVFAEAGDTISVPMPALPAVLPGALRARGVHWQAEGVASLLGGGRAVLVAPGTAAITAISPVGVVRTPVAVRPVVRGRLYQLSPDGPGAGAPASARIIVRRGAAVDTTWTDAAGRFRLTLPVAVDADAPADVRVEPAASAGGERTSYAPVVLRAVPAGRLHMLGVVVLPTRWPIETGSFAGTTVAIRAAAARGFWQFTRDHGLPVGRLHDAPYTVAFAPGFDPADVATVWRAARSLEDAWGHPLFVPHVPSASADSAHAADPDVLVRAVPALRADGLTTLGWDGGGVVGPAAIDFRTLSPGTLRSQVVEHELLHALGFGHARGWPSVLAPAGRPLAAAPTTADVAYGQLYEALRREARRAEHEYGAAYGWADAAP